MCSHKHTIYLDHSYSFERHTYIFLLFVWRTGVANRVTRVSSSPFKMTFFPRVTDIPLIHISNICINSWKFQFFVRRLYYLLVCAKISNLLLLFSLQSVGWHPGNTNFQFGKLGVFVVSFSLFGTVV